MARTIESIWGQKHQICRENFIFGYTDNITHLWEIRRKGITHFKRQGFVFILFQRDGLFNFLCIFWNVEELRGLSMWSKYSTTDTHTHTEFYNIFKLRLKLWQQNIILHDFASTYPNVFWSSFHKATTSNNINRSSIYFIIRVMA